MFSKQKLYQLQTYIDNRNNDKKVGLKKLTYFVGWHNVKTDCVVSTTKNRYLAKKGLYSFYDLARILKESLNIVLNVDRYNGIASAMILPGEKLFIPECISYMLGVPTSYEFEGNIEEDRFGTVENKFLITRRTIGGLIFEYESETLGVLPINFSGAREIRVYLDQINTTTNYLNGSSSTLLESIPVVESSFGDLKFYNFELPVFKDLTNN